MGEAVGVDLESGKYQPIVRLPGFTRGLDFCGKYAFVGLSQVRESAVFSGLPITEQDERYSGVWVVDLESGQIAAFLRFDGAVREIFAVTLLPNIRFPELVVDDAKMLSDAFVLPEPNQFVGAIRFTDQRVPQLSGCKSPQSTWDPGSETEHSN